jgi:hypothetical protein
LRSFIDRQIIKAAQTGNFALRLSMRSLYPNVLLQEAHSCRDERHPETNEYQSRRTEERQGRTGEIFALFVSSWLIFLGVIV